MTHISYCFPDFVHMLGLGAWRQHGDSLTSLKTLKHYVFEIIQKAGEWDTREPIYIIYIYMYIYICKYILYIMYTTLI